MENLDQEIIQWIQLAKGDITGHEFHGNQYTTGFGAMSNQGYGTVVAAKAFMIDTSGQGSLRPTDPAPLGKDLPLPRIAEVSVQQRNGSISPQYNFAHSDAKPGELVHPKSDYDIISMDTKGELTIHTEQTVSVPDGDGWNSPAYEDMDTTHNYYTNIEDQLPIMGKGISEMHDSPLAGCTDFSLSREAGSKTPSVVTPNTMVWGTMPTGERAPMTTVAQFLHAGQYTDPFFEASQDDFDAENNGSW